MALLRLYRCFSGLAIAAIVGIFLNAIMPDKLGMKVKSFKGKEKS
jgi:uracil permease